MIRNTITGSLPVHLHANGNARVLGWANAFWRQIADQPEAPATTRGREALCRLEIVTCSTYLRHTTAIEKSCRYWGVGLVVLSPTKDTPWRNWLRFDLSRRRCERTAADWLLFTDATDAIFTRHPSEALNELGALGRDGAIAAERNHWPTDCPVPSYLGTYPNGNGGGILGRRELLVELFREADQHRSAACPRSDQYGLRIAAERLGVTPDTEAAIFQTLAYTAPGEVETIQ